MLGKPTIRMPAIDPSIVKIAVELENHTAQLIEFDQKNKLSGKLKVKILFYFSFIHQFISINFQR